MNELLRVRRLTTRYFKENGRVDALTDLDLTVDRDEIYGLIGQSGSGKTTAAFSIMDAVPAPGRITAGEIWFRHPELAKRYGADRPEAVEGEVVDLRRLPPPARRRLNQGPLRMIPEDAHEGFNPSLTIGDRLEEALRGVRPTGVSMAGEEPTLTDRIRSWLPNRSSTARQRRDRVVALLRRVGIDDPESTLDGYPHELSSGVLRRVAVAEAVAPGPDLLIADEPTAGLAGTEQRHLLTFLDTVRDETGMSILLLSHSRSIISRMCDRVGVLYDGELVAAGTPEAVFEAPVHPSLHGLE